jgi:hypothetical protein
MDKVEAIRALPEPHTKKLLRGFLGMCNFYRMYIPNFSSVALPLTEMTKKSQSNRVILNDEQRRAFLLLKEKLCTCTHLYAVDFTKPFHLFTDASDLALGVALTQLAEDGSHKPVAFASAKFSGAQLNWSTIEKEAYSVIYALKKFEHLLFGHEIHLWSDHNPLSYITSSVPQAPKLTRWALSLAKFDISVKHIAGNLNVVADFLSRACV